MLSYLGLVLVQPRLHFFALVVDEGLGPHEVVPKKLQRLEALLDVLSGLRQLQLVLKLQINVICNVTTG